MIPFGLFHAFLFIENDNIEVRALELSPSSFTFRLAPCHQELLPSLKALKLVFCSPVKHTGAELYLEDYMIQEIESNPFFKTYQASISNMNYKKQALALSQEYLEYIERKNSLLPEELSHAYYPAYPEEQEELFHTDWASQQEAWGREVMDAIVSPASDFEVLMDEFPEGEPFECDFPELGITLKYPGDLKDWLSMTPKAYLKKRLDQAHLSGHPLRKVSPSYVYVGDSCCPLLFPKSDDYPDLIAHCKMHGQKLVFLLAPVPEALLEQICDQLQDLNQLLLKESYSCQIEVGDMGMFDFCKNLEGFEKISKGLLFWKKKKDPRLKYQDSTKFQDKVFLSHLDETEDTVYLPYYQTNTGTFCPLQALWKQGDRSKQKRILACDGLCKKHKILYPAHLDMVGIGNSLYGFSKESLIHGYKRIEKRLILNL